MDDVDRLLATTDAAMKTAAGALRTQSEWIDTYDEMIGLFGQTTGHLVAEMEQLASARGHRRLTLWGIALVVAMVGVLGLWWSSRRGEGEFTTVLLQAAGGALITFSLVGVALDSVVQMSSNQANKLAAIVERSRSTVESMIEIVTTMREQMWPRRAEIAENLERMDKLLEDRRE